MSIITFADSELPAFIIALMAMTISRSTALSFMSSRRSITFFLFITACQKSRQAIASRPVG